MKLTKQQLNKKLNSKVLNPDGRYNSYNVKNLRVRVIRARDVNRLDGVTLTTATTIKISGMVKSSNGVWLSLDRYGPKSIRKFIRREDNGIVRTISQWVRLWGFNSDVYLETIDLVDNV